MDINQTDTLNYREGRDNDDERHLPASVGRYRASASCGQRQMIL